MTQPCSFGIGGRRLALLLLGGSLVLACGSTDDRKLMQPFRVSSSGGAGSIPSPDGGGSGGLAGGDGSGAPGLPDAGGDAATEAAGPERGCRIGALSDYCAADFACPASPAAARAELQVGPFNLTPVIIVQRACSAANGAARISVSANYLSLAMNYIYDAQTQQLVSVQVVDDVGCRLEGLNPDGFGQYPGYYGEESPDCSTDLSLSAVPAACNLPDDWQALHPGGAATDAGTDAGPVGGGPYECILVP